MTELKKKYQKIAIVVGVLLLIVKFIAYSITDSNAILSDALESIVNVVASSFALYSINLAALPQDKNHPYGHGKIEFLSIGLEGSLILIAGLFAIGKATYNLFYPQLIQDVKIGIYFTIFSGLINFGLAQMLIRQGKKLHSISMTGDGKHLMTDVVSSVGLIIGLGIIYFTGIWWIDNVIAIVFGVFIIISGYSLVRNSIAGIMDEADVELIDRIVKILDMNRRENWIDIHNLRIIKYGDRLHVDSHATIPYYLELKEAHDEVSLIDRIVDKNIPNNMEFFIHADPCEPPRNCSICIKSNCPVRGMPFEKRIHWKVENVLPNEKHTLKTQG